MFVEVPIIGTGTMKDPYRPDVPKGVAYSCNIETGPDGKPVRTKTVVCVPDSAEIPGTNLSRVEAARFFKDRAINLKMLKVPGATPLSDQEIEDGKKPDSVGRL